jgi:hypothetical protein
MVISEMLVAFLASILLIFAAVDVKLTFSIS